MMTWMAVVKPAPEAENCCSWMMSNVCGLDLEVHGQEAQQHEHRPEQRVQEELDRRVVAVRRAPDADQEVHRDQHELPEHEEQDKVERDERAGHARLQQQHQGQERLRAAGARQHLVGVDGAEERQQEGQFEQWQADAVDAHVVVSVDDVDPVDVEFELQPGVVAEVEAEQHDDGHDQSGAGEQDAERPHQPVLVLRDHRDDQRPGHRQEHRQGDRRLLPTAHLRSSLRFVSGQGLPEQGDEDGEGGHADEQEDGVPLDVPAPEHGADLGR